MPEGDTIHKLAAAMRPRLLGETLLGARMQCEPSGTFTRGRRAGGPEPERNFEGRVVKEVYALGKHLIVALDDGLLLRSHLGMHGAWHRYRPQEPLSSRATIPKHAPNSFTTMAMLSRSRCISTKSSSIRFVSGTKRAGLT